MKESRKKVLKQICAWVLALVALATSIPLNNGLDGIFADVDDVMEDVVGGTETTPKETRTKPTKEEEISEEDEETESTESTEAVPEPEIANVEYVDPEPTTPSKGSVFLSLTEGGSVDVYTEDGKYTYTRKSDEEVTRANPDGEESNVSNEFINGYIHLADSEIGSTIRVDAAPKSSKYVVESYRILTDSGDILESPNDFVLFSEDAYSHDVTIQEKASYVEVVFLKNDKLKIEEGALDDVYGEVFEVPGEGEFLVGKVMKSAPMKAAPSTGDTGSIGTGVVTQNTEAFHTAGLISHHFFVSVEGGSERGAMCIDGAMAPPPKNTSYTVKAYDGSAMSGNDRLLVAAFLTSLWSETRQLPAGTDTTDASIWNRWSGALGGQSGWEFMSLHIVASYLSGSSYNAIYKYQDVVQATVADLSTWVGNNPSYVDATDLYMLECPRKQNLVYVEMNLGASVQVIKKAKDGKEYDFTGTTISLYTRKLTKAERENPNAVDSEGNLVVSPAYTITIANATDAKGAVVKAKEVVSGVVSIEPGTYYAYETAVSAGFERTKTLIESKTVRAGDDTWVINLANELHNDPGAFKIKKIGGASPEPIPDAVFSVTPYVGATKITGTGSSYSCKKDEPQSDGTTKEVAVAAGTTFYVKSDAKGEAKLDPAYKWKDSPNLPTSWDDGIYVIKEYSAPSGYNKTDDVYYLKKSNNTWSKPAPVGTESEYIDYIGNTVKIAEPPKTYNVEIWKMMYYYWDKYTSSFTSFTRNRIVDNASAGLSTVNGTGIQLYWEGPLYGDKESVEYNGKTYKVGKKIADGIIGSSGNDPGTYTFKDLPAGKYKIIENPRVIGRGLLYSDEYEYIITLNDETCPNGSYDWNSDAVEDTDGYNRVDSGDGIFVNNLITGGLIVYKVDPAVPFDVTTTNKEGNEVKGYSTPELAAGQGSNLIGTTFEVSAVHDCLTWSYQSAGGDSVTHELLQRKAGDVLYGANGKDGGALGVHLYCLAHDDECGGNVCSQSGTHAYIMAAKTPYDDCFSQGFYKVTETKTSDGYMKSKDNSSPSVYVYVQRSNYLNPYVETDVRVIQQTLDALYEGKNAPVFNGTPYKIGSNLPSKAEVENNYKFISDYNKSNLAENTVVDSAKYGDAEFRKVLEQVDGTPLQPSTLLGDTQFNQQISIYYNDAGFVMGSNGKPCHSVNGAPTQNDNPVVVLQVNKTTGEASTKYNAVIGDKTNCSWKLPFGQYVAKETNPGTGARNKEKLIYFEVGENGTKYMDGSSYQYTANKADDFVNPPQRGDIEIYKLCKELNGGDYNYTNPHNLTVGDGTAQGDGSLAGIEFEIRNVSNHMVQRLDGTFCDPGDPSKASEEREIVTTIKTELVGSGANLKAVARTTGGALSYGTYQVKEIATNGTYLLTDGQPKTIYVHSDNTTVNVDSTGKLAKYYDNPVRGGVTVQKVDNDLKRNYAQGDATLEGAVFTITNMSDNPVLVNDVYYPTAKGNPDNESKAVVMTLTTNDQGYASSSVSALPYGTYMIQEVTPPTGYLLDDDFNLVNRANLFTVRVNGEINKFEFDANKDPVETTNQFKRNEDPVIRGGVMVWKFDKELDKSEAINGWNHVITKDDSSLEKIDFEIKNLSEHNVWVDGDDGLREYVPGEKVITITTSWNEEKKAYTAQTSNDCLPYGTYSIREIKSNDSYLLTDGEPRTFKIRENGKIVTVDDEGKDLIWKDYVKRSNIKVVKHADDANNISLQVAFVVTSLATGESHVIVTDANGEYASISDESLGGRPHSLNTNANDWMIDAFAENPERVFDIAKEGNNNSA